MLLRFAKGTVVLAAVGCIGCIASIAVLGGCGPSGEAALRPALPLLKMDRAIVPALTAEASCDDAEAPRVPLGRIQWKTNAGQFATQRIDIAATKDGFERGHFIAIAGLKLQAAPKMMRAPGLPADPTPLERTLSVRPAAPRLVADRVALDVHQLEPGILYSLRVVTRTPRGLVPGPIVRVQAPVCPVDYVEERR